MKQSVLITLFFIFFISLSARGQIDEIKQTKVEISPSLIPGMTDLDQLENKSVAILDTLSWIEDNHTIKRIHLTQKFFEDNIVINLLDYEMLNGLLSKKNKLIIIKGILMKKKTGKYYINISKSGQVFEYSTY